jgi:hypothetical protein
MRWYVQLYPETLPKELIKILSHLLGHQHATALRIFQRTTSPSHHLQDIHDGVIDVAVLFDLMTERRCCEKIDGYRETPGSVLLCCSALKM